MKLSEILKQADQRRNHDTHRAELRLEDIRKIQAFFLQEDETLHEERMKASLDFLNSCLKQDKNQKEISKEELLTAYLFCTKAEQTDTVDENEVYRKKEHYIFNSTVKASDAQEINHFMDHFMSQMHYSKNWMHEIEFAVMSHKRILDIQPFQKHNTFMAFWLLNRILLSSGYPPMILTQETFEQYKKAYFATRSMHNPDIDGFIENVITNMQR